MEQKGTNSPSGPEVHWGGSGFNRLEVVLEAGESHTLDRFHTPVPRRMEGEVTVEAALRCESFAVLRSGFCVQKNKFILNLFSSTRVSLLF